MKSRIALPILVSGLAFSAGPSFAASPKGAPAVHALVISNVQFPNAEKVKPGDTITWKNDDLVPHTVTAEDGSFKSPTIEAGKDWSMQVPPVAKKTIAYKCDFHPNMHSTLIVQ